MKVKMPCSVCKQNGHNKRTCEQKRKDIVAVSTSSPLQLPLPTPLQKKVSGLIMNRISTMRYEATKTLIAKVPKGNYTDFEEDINKMMCSPICVYCGEVGRIKSDHFHSVVSKDLTARLTFNDFSELKVPCCNKCNSSKGNKNWKEFISKKSHIEGYDARVQILERLDAAISEKKKMYCVRKEQLELVQKAEEEFLKACEAYQKQINLAELIPVKAALAVEE